MKMTSKMKITVVILALFSMTSAFGMKKVNEKYGAPITLTESVSLDQAIAGLTVADSSKAAKSPILVQAKVDSVCEKKGCWMGLKTETHAARVTFKDYKYFVPVSLKGKTVKIEGILEEKKLSLKETKHYVKDAGGDPSKVTEPKTEFQIVASGLEVIE